MNSVGKLSLPASCYIDVILSNQWKTDLSTNKSGLARHEDDLLEKLEEMLGDWLQKHKETAATFKLQSVADATAARINEVIALLEANTPGNNKPKPSDKKQSVPGKKRKTRISRKQRKQRHRAINGGDASHKPERRPRAGALLEIHPDKTLGYLLSAASVTSEAVVVHLNVGPHNREIAEHFNRGKVDDLYKIAAMIYSDTVAQHRKSFRGLFHLLRKAGYPIDDDDSDQRVSNLVANYLLHSQFGRQGSIAKMAA